MRKKILFTAAALVLAGLVYFFYPTFKNLFLKGASREIINTSVQNDSKSENNENQNTDSENKEQEKNTIAPNIEVKPIDCDNNCSKYKKESEKEYCQEICGTQTYFEDAQEEGGSSEDCASEKGIQKDYCLKDIAVGNKDFKTCDEIKDANVKKSCQNRITEDLLEEQGSPE